MSSEMEPATQAELRKDWGDKRFAEALGCLSGWYQNHGVPESVEQIEKILVEEPDAFEVFKARIWEESTKILAELKKEAANGN